MLLSDFVSRDGIKRVLICRKPRDEAVAQAFDLAVECVLFLHIHESVHLLVVCRYMRKKYENVTMFVEASSKIPVGVEPYHPRSGAPSFLPFLPIACGTNLGLPRQHIGQISI